MKMRVARWMTGIGLGALGAAGLLASTALQAQDRGQLRLAKRQVTESSGGIGVFTPAAADPKLAAVLARSGLSESNFRFTPSESRRQATRGVTVAVRARSTRTLAETASRGAAAPESVSLAPIAYNLGVSVGWKRFVVSGDLGKIDLVTQPGGREHADVGVAYTGKRVAGRVQAARDLPLANAPALTGDNPSYSLDMAGSYSLTRNLDVTAGVRYKSERERLPQLSSDNRRDSQAVYVGTAFRF
jgi:hypothetical protein